MFGTKFLSFDASDFDEHIELLNILHRVINFSEIRNNEFANEALRTDRNGFHFSTRIFLRTSFKLPKEIMDDMFGKLEGY